MTGVDPVTVKQPRVLDRRPADEAEPLTSKIQPLHLRKTKFASLCLANSWEGIAARHYAMPDQDKLMPLWPVPLPNMASFDAVTSVHFSVHWGQKLLGTKAAAKVFANYRDMARAVSSVG